MNYLYYSYYAILLLTFLCALYRYKIVSRALKFLVVLLGASCASEGIAYYASIKYHNNMPVYAIYNLVELGLTSLYFNYCIIAFEKRKIGYYIAFAGIILGTVNILFIQGPDVVDSYFMVLEGLFIMGMSIISLFQLLMKKGELRLYKYPDFWVAIIFLFFWSATVLNWTVYNFFIVRFTAYIPVIDVSLVVVNIFVYIGLGCIFILYPRLYDSAKR